MCRLNWQRHNEIRNKITLRRSMWKIVIVMKTKPCEYTKECNANKKKSRADYDVKMEKACYIKLTSDIDFFVIS